MAIKSVTLLILFFKIVLLEVEVTKPECTLDMIQPPTCICNSSSIITVNETSTNYSVLVNASLCHNGYCIPDYLHTYNSKCDDICQLCESLHISDCPYSNLNISICENKVDEHLNNLCKNKISVVTMFNITNITVTTTVPQPCPTITETVSTCITNSTTKQPVTFASSTEPIQPMERKLLANLETNTLLVLILGALLALSILLLLIVITGWVCTCVSMKKRKVKKSYVHSRNTDETDEKYFENPTYDGISITRPLTGTSRPDPTGYKPPVAQKPKVLPRATHAIYDDAVHTTTPKTAGKGQTYDVLDRGKVNEIDDHTITYST